jgi:hypothetical protein
MKMKRPYPQGGVVYIEIPFQPKKPAISTKIWETAGACE